MTYRILLALFTALALAACGDEPSSPVDNPGGTGGDAGEGGAGGDGGTGGEGGTGGTGGTGGDHSPDPGDWEGVSYRLAWRHQGLGDVFGILVADFSGDGEDELAVGGRRPFLLAGDGSSIAWYVDWEPADLLTKGGDSEFVYGLAAIPSDEGGADLLVTSSLGDAFLVDGRTGERIWHNWLDVTFPFVHLAVFGDPEDPLLFTAYGKKAYRAKTGELAWTAPVSSPTWVRSIRLQEGEPTALLVGEEMGQTTDGTKLNVPTVHVLDADGELVFEKALPQTRQLTNVFPADVNGDGVQEIVLHLDWNVVAAMGLDGSTLWETTVTLFAEPWDHMLEDFSVADVDGDGTEEILLLYTNGFDSTVARTSTLVLLGADGTIRWTWNTGYYSTKGTFARIGSQLVVLVASGNPYLSTSGALLVLDPTVAPDGGGILLHHQTFYPVTHTAVLEREGAISIAYAGLDGAMRTIDWASQEEGWSHHWLNWVQKSVAVENGDEFLLALADGYGYLSLLDNAGKLKWKLHTANGNAGEVTALAQGRLGGETRIVAAAIAIDRGTATIETYSLNGQRRTSTTVGGRVLYLHVADLDGDDKNEILYVTEDNKSFCRFHVATEAGAPVHELELGLCLEAEIVTGEVDGEMLVAVRTHPIILPAPPRLFLVAGDGTVRWYFDESVQVTLWMQFSEYGLVTGGGSTTADGFVALRDYATGEKIWSTALLDDKDEFGADPSWYGILVHTDGDYVATHTARGNVYLLDQRTGKIYWSTSTDKPDALPTEDRDGAPLVLVPATDDTPAFLAVSQGLYGRSRSRTYALALDGEFKGELMMPSEAQQAHFFRLADGTPAAAIVNSLGVYAVTLGKENGP